MAAAQQLKSGRDEYPNQTTWDKIVQEDHSTAYKEKMRTVGFMIVTFIIIVVSIVYNRKKHKEGNIRKANFEADDSENDENPSADSAECEEEMLLSKNGGKEAPKKGSDLSSIELKADEEQARGRRRVPPHLRINFRGKHSRTAVDGLEYSEMR